MELLRAKSWRDFVPSQRRGDWGAWVSTEHVGRGNGFALGDLLPIEIHFAFFAARYGPRGSEEIRSLSCSQRRQRFGERADLGVGVARSQRDEDMHPVAACGLGKAQEPYAIQTAAHP